jgi:hypothetical protein
MQVNVFISREAGHLHDKLLVLPMAPKAPIPKTYRVGWQYFATTDTADAMFGNVDPRAIEVELSSNGFAIVSPHAPDQ